MGDIENLADLLPTYYTRLFPFVDFYNWLSYGNVSTFGKREFSFTLQDDIYIRFQFFKSQKDLEAEIKRLLPFKIDIGAVYIGDPKYQKQAHNRPCERELVFDIDMTDYDDVRTCCQGADVCVKCWKFMALACKVIDIALRDDFGFKHILWIFSGRRGIHCWVCDPEARTLTGPERACVAEYLQLIEGGEHMRKKVHLPGERIHPSVRRALDIIDPVFEDICVQDQNMLGTPEAIDKFLLILSEEEDRRKLKELFEQCATSLARWDIFVKFVKEKSQGNKKRYRHLVEEIKLQYLYPRLDINVSKGMNHLLKSPFCVHPKTGKVCIPFTANTADKFDPTKVPTIMTLIDEIHKFNLKEKAINEEHATSTQNIKDYKKTSLNRYLRVFHEFLRDLKAARQGERIKESDMTMEF